MKPLSRDLKGSQFFGVNLMHRIKPLNLITGEEKKLHWARKWEPESIRMSDTVTGTHIFCIWILCRVVCGSEEEKGGGAAAHLLRIIWWWTGIRRMCAGGMKWEGVYFIQMIFRIQMLFIRRKEGRENGEGGWGSIQHVKRSQVTILYLFSHFHCDL